LPRAREVALKSNKKVVAGGPAVKLMPDYLSDVAEVQDSTIYPALAFHNPLATFTTRGCPNKCAFCAVPNTEGDLVELWTWPVLPVVCDNNLLAASDGHFNRVIKSLKVLPYVDFNQGLDARLFNEYHARKVAELRAAKVRFAFDHISQEVELVRSVELAKAHGLNDLGVYVLIGYEETPDDAFYRLETVRGLGVRPNPMRYRPLYALSKDDYFPSAWVHYFGSQARAEIELLRYMQYYSKLRYVEHVPFEDYKYRDDERNQIELFV